jgi:hypothetical protein
LLITVKHFLFSLHLPKDIEFPKTFYALNVMKATWICVTLLLGQLYLVSAVHNITEALEALAPVPIDDLQTKTSLMEETDTSFSVTNTARKVENEYWLMSLFVVLGYLLQ